MASDPLERLLPRSDGREFHTGLLFGDAQPDTALAAGEQSLQESLRQRNCDVPHQRRRNVADGSKLGFPRFRGGKGRGPRQEGYFYGKIDGWENELPGTKRPPLPPGVPAGSHGGSHGHLMNEFVTAILQDRKPLVDIAQALNMTVAGIVAHQSASKGGELLKIPQYHVG